MKPQRMRMTHALILSYNLYKDMEVYRPHEAEQGELVAFHDSDYVNFLSEVTVDNYKHYSNQLKRFNLGVGETPDCPVFDGVFEFQASCAGASIDAATQLNHKNCDIALNWAGGLHHAKRSEAAGFCYMNDIVLGIIELLKYHTRVLYIDIDIHHGDGVEEAFYLSHRVMTVSFHKYGDSFFPGTGDIVDHGAGAGKYFAVNVPLADGLDDASFVPLYEAVITKCIDSFRPEAIVLQCGADSITGDRLGRFNVTTKGHAAAVEFTKSFRIPLMILGGGGYTIRNVARAWVYETAVALNKTKVLGDTIPNNEYFEYFAPEYNLHLHADPNFVNRNSTEYLAKLQEKILTNLSHLEHAPSVQFSHVPHDLFLSDDNDVTADMAAIDWDGGGLASDPDELYSLSTALLPRHLRRANNPDDPDPGDDRDQKAALKNITIASDLLPI